MAITSFVTDQTKPGRLGNSVFGMLSGTFVSASFVYDEIIDLLEPFFLPSPPPRVVWVANDLVSNGQTFIAIGRAV